MTGPTSVLAPWQIAELREFADGKPHRPARKPTALLRRGMLMGVGKHGETAYLITAFGRSALTLHDNRLVTPRTGTIRSRELFGRDHWDALPIIEEDAIYPRDEEHRYSLLERFREQRESAVRVGECLLWGATLPQPNGYAVVRIRRVGREYAHRLSWEDAFGPIPVGGHVLHRCDTPLCIEPRHLFLGDQRSNTADMRAKGRDDTSGLQRRGEWTHCKRGHLLAGENLIVHKDGSRECRACRRRRARARHA